MINKTKVKIVSLLILIVILLFFAMVSDCNGQIRNYGVNDKGIIQGSIYKPDVMGNIDSPLWKWYDVQKTKQRLYTSRFYLIIYDSDSTTYKLEIPLKELPELINIMDAALRKRGINSRVIIDKNPNQ